MYYSFLLRVFVKIHMLGARGSNYVEALKSTLQFLKTWKAKVVGTFCSHNGTVFQADAESYFA